MHEFAPLHATAAGPPTEPTTEFHAVIGSVTLHRSPLRFRYAMLFQNAKLAGVTLRYTPPAVGAEPSATVLS